MINSQGWGIGTQTPSWEKLYKLRRKGAIIIQSEGGFKIKIYRHRDDERELVTECLLNFPTHIDLGRDAERKVTGQLSVRPKIGRCRPEVEKELIEKIEAQLGDEIGNEIRGGRGIEAIIHRYKHPTGGKMIDDYSWTIEVLK